MVTVKSLVKENTFYDSLTLMRISKSASELKDVNQAVVVMASDVNKKMLADVGLITNQVEHAGANDLVIVISTENSTNAELIIRRIENMLVDMRVPKGTKSLPRTIESAIDQMPDANMVVISVPGPFAKLEAKKALERGLNVFLFSDGVSLEDELELKKIARNKDLFMMGPGCGTAIMNGVYLGFANVVKRGPVGIVGAAGTGIQQVSALIHHENSGVSQAIGTGGRDLSDKIGGIMMTKGIQMLSEDSETKVIILISKPPGPKTERNILKMNCGKPVVVCFIGGKSTSLNDNIFVSVETLEDAATTAVALLKDEIPKRALFSSPTHEILNVAQSDWVKLKPQQNYVRGLYSGGTVCSESYYILSKLLHNVHSNIAGSEFKLSYLTNSKEHTCLDMGEEEFTSGRAHPMIDLTLRQQRLVHEAKDGECAVILLDIVLGYGSHNDPAGELAKSIKDAKSLCKEHGRYLSVVGSVIGTDNDPQGFKNQIDKLTNVGVIVMPSNAQAARMAALIATKGELAGEFLRNA